MNCSSEIKLMELADGELVHIERQTLEAHTAACPSCRKILQEFRQINALGRSTLADMALPVKDTAIVSTRRDLLINRPLTIAAAVTIAAIIIWSPTRKPTDSPDQTSVMQSDLAAPLQKTEIDPARFSDEVFEAWAEPFRKRRIPLIALHELPYYFENTQ